MGRVGSELDAEKRRCLKLDPAPPALSRLGEDRPADSSLRAYAVDMSANGRRPVRIGRAQAELHACADVERAPVRRTILDHGVQRVLEFAGRVSLPPPDMSFVEMSMDVDEQRQHDAA